MTKNKKAVIIGISLALLAVIGITISAIALRPAKAETERANTTTQNAFNMEGEMIATAQASDTIINITMKDNITIQQYYFPMLYIFVTDEATQEKAGDLEIWFANVNSNERTKQSAVAFTSGNNAYMYSSFGMYQDLYNWIKQDEENRGVQIRKKSGGTISFAYLNIVSIPSTLDYSNFISDATKLSPTSIATISRNLNNAYENGYNTGVNDQVIGSQSWQAGYNQGIEEGRNDGYNNGYDNGYSAGKAYGEANPNDSVKNVYYNNGYAKGYEEGVNAEDTLNSFILSIAAVPVNMLAGMFNLNILGVNIANLVFSLLTAGIVILVLKKIL